MAAAILLPSLQTWTPPDHSLIARPWGLRVRQRMNASALDAGRSTAFLRFKKHILDTLELGVSMTVPSWLRNGSRILDVGAGSGEIDRYLVTKFGVRIKA